MSGGGFLDTVLELIGVKAGVIIAAFGGALTRIAFFPAAAGTGVFQTIMSVIGGTLAAVYLGPVAPVYFGWRDAGQPAMAFVFIVGLAGMEICKQVIAAASKWTPQIGRGAKDV